MSRDEATQLRGPCANVCQGDGTCRDKRNEALVQEFVFHGRTYLSSTDSCFAEFGEN